MISVLWWFFWIACSVCLIIILTFGFVLLFGAPYLPTIKKQREEALDLLNLKPEQVFVDLGCGDGRMLSLAAERGLRAVGYELNPFLAFYSWITTRRYGRQVKVRWGSFWQADLSETDGVFVFLIGHFMRRLDKFLGNSAKTKQLKLVSNSFEIPGKKPLRRRGALLLYVYKPR